MLNRLIVSLILLSGLAHADDWTGDDKTSTLLVAH